MTTSFSKHSNKTQALSEHLTRLAQSLGPDAKLPTVQALRRELNVSITTLDSALTKLESQKVIYRKHGIGIFVSPRLGEKCVGLVVGPEFFQAGTSPFWRELIEGIQARTAAKGESSRFYLALSGRHGLPVKEDLLEDIQAGRLDGVVFIGNNEAAVQWIEEQGVPIVGFAGKIPHNVQLNYKSLIRMGVGELAQKGCRRVAFLKYTTKDDGRLTYPELSVLGSHFVSEIEKAQLPFEARFLQDSAYFPDHTESNQMQGFEAIQRLWDDTVGDKPDALLINDDMMTRGALVALEKRGVKINEDVHVASHINKGSAVLHGYEGAVTLLEYDPAEVVSALFDLLETRMNGASDSHSQLQIEPYVVKQTKPTS